jgi:hypothetical protein
MLAKLIMAGLAAGAILFCAGDAIARPKHCPPGHAKKGWCVPGQGQFGGRGWHEDRYDRRGSRIEYYGGQRRYGDRYDRHQPRVEYYQERRAAPFYDERRWRY